MPLDEENLPVTELLISDAPRPEAVYFCHIFPHCVGNHKLYIISSFQKCNDGLLNGVILYSADPVCYI